MHRFFVAEPLAVGANAEVDALAPQLAQVLRMQVGDELILLDGSGLEFSSRLLRLQRRAAAVEVLSAQPCEAEPSRFLTLYQCSLKHDKFEWVLQKGTELGVSRFVPVISARSIVRPAEALLKKYERWGAIVREAAEQCGRGRIPEIAPPLDWSAALAAGKGLRLLAWEEGQAEPPLLTVLQQNLKEYESTAIIIGPEGGISQSEALAAAAQGWQFVSLGPRILRAETAAVVAAAAWAGVESGTPAVEKLKSNF
jgi:16S rRNA (uracil1498-N3)-methyltransferase